jgi:hypothetical protein
MSVDLKLDAGTSIIVFDTELGNQIHLKAKLKNEDTDTIRLYRSGYLEELSKEVSDSHGYTAGIRRRVGLIEIHACTFECDAKPNKIMNVWVDPLFRN